MSAALLTQIGGISNVRTVDITPSQTDFLPLDERLRDMFASSAVNTQNEQASIMAKVNDPDILSSPGGVLELQVALGEYRYKVETISALTRKAVSTAETLLRT